MGNKRFFKASFSYTILDVLQKGILFLILPFITKAMSPEEYGVVATSLIVISFLSLSFTLSFHGAISRYYSRYRDNLRSVFVSTIFIFTFVVVIFFAPLVYFLMEKYAFIWMPEIDNSNYLIFIIIISGLQPFITIILSLLQIKQDLKFFSFFSLVYFGIKMILFYVMVLELNMEAEGYLLSLLISNVVLFFLSILYVIFKYGFLFDFRFVKRSIRYSLPILPLDLLNFVNNIVDRAYIVSFVGLAAVGIYFLGVQLSSLILLVIYAINSAYIPYFYKITRDGRENYYKIYSYFDFYVLSVFALFFISAAFSNDIITYFFDDNYSSLNEYVVLLLFNASLNSIYVLNTNILSLNVKLVRYKTLLVILGVLINFVSGYVFVELFGVVGAVYSSLLATVIIILGFMRVVSNNTKFKVNNRYHIFIAIVSLALVHLTEFLSSLSNAPFLMKVLVSLSLLFLSFLLGRKKISLFMKVITSS